MAMSENLEFPNFFGTVRDLAQARYLMAERDKIKGVGIDPNDVSATMRGDRDALGRVAAVNPDFATRLTTAVASMDARQAAVAKSHFELAGRLAAGVLSAPPDQRPSLYASALEQARGLGIDTRNFPQEYSPAAEAWLKHNAAMLGSANQVFKRIGIGGGAPAAGGGGGWTNPGPAAGPRADAAPAPTGMPTAVAGAPVPLAGPTMASAAPPPVAPPPIRPGAPPPVGPRGDDLTDFEWGGAIARAPQAPPTLASAPALPPPSPVPLPARAPVAAPAARPTQVAGGPPVTGGGVPDDSGGEGDFVPPDRVGTGRWVGLDPGDTIKVDRHNEPISKDGMLFIQKKDGRLMMFDPKSRKTFTPVAAGDQIHLIDNESGDTVRTIPVTKPREQIEPLGAPAGAPTDPRAAVRGLQLPPGYRVGGANGVPIVKDGTVMVVAPDGSYDFVPLPTRADPQQALDLATAKAQANAKAIPPAVLHGIDTNLTSLRKIDTVMAELAKHPDSVGGPGSVLAANLPGAGGLQNRIDREGVTLRSLIADIGSLKIHDRSGAAVTASEEPRLRPFIPSISDDAPTVRAKLANFKNEYMAVLRDQAAYYTPDNGFKPYKALVDYVGAGGAPPAAGGPPAAPTDKPALIYDPKSGGFQ